MRSGDLCGNCGDGNSGVDGDPAGSRVIAPEVQAPIFERLYCVDSG